MTAVLYPQWMLDIVAPDAVYASDAAIMTKAIALTLSGLERRQGGPFGAIVATASGEIITHTTKCSRRWMSPPMPKS